MFCVYRGTFMIYLTPFQLPPQQTASVLRQEYKMNGFGLSLLLALISGGSKGVQEVQMHPFKISKRLTF